MWSGVPFSARVGRTYEPGAPRGEQQILEEEDGEESRKKERELLRIAKLKFFEENGATAELTRWKIKRLKRDIRA